MQSGVQKFASPKLNKGIAVPTDNDELFRPLTFHTN
ncbi:hypothetical protein AVEN_43201-1, partial [Araneus ventricosus]